MLAGLIKLPDSISPLGCYTHNTPQNMPAYHTYLNSILPESFSDVIPNKHGAEEIGLGIDISHAVTYDIAARFIKTVEKYFSRQGPVFVERLSYVADSGDAIPFKMRYHQDRQISSICLTNGIRAIVEDLGRKYQFHVPMTLTSHREMVFAYMHSVLSNLGEPYARLTENVSKILNARGEYGRQGTWHFEVAHDCYTLHHMRVDIHKCVSYLMTHSDDVWDEVNVADFMRSNPQPLPPIMDHVTWKCINMSTPMVDLKSLPIISGPSRNDYLRFDDSEEALSKKIQLPDSACDHNPVEWRPLAHQLNVFPLTDFDATFVIGASPLQSMAYSDVSYVEYAYNRFLNVPYTDDEIFDLLHQLTPHLTVAIPNCPDKDPTPDKSKDDYISSALFEIRIVRSFRETVYICITNADTGDVYHEIFLDLVWLSLGTFGISHSDETVRSLEIL